MIYTGDLCWSMLYFGKPAWALLFVRWGRVVVTFLAGGEQWSRRGTGKREQWIMVLAGKMVMCITGVKLRQLWETKSGLLKALEGGPYGIGTSHLQVQQYQGLQTWPRKLGSVLTFDERELYKTNLTEKTLYKLNLIKFVAEPVASLFQSTNRFASLMNDLERNNMKFPTVSVNTKFLNSLQPEWLKYVTQVRLAKRLTVDSFDDLFDYLSQFEKLVNASRAKKLEKSHDPLALVAHTGSSSRNTSSYYVTHPSSVVDYDEEYEQDDVHNHSEDPLASAMLLLAKAITQNFSNPTNNRLRASSNTRNQAVVQGEVVEGMNATNETANVQRIVRTPTHKQYINGCNAITADEAGVNLPRAERFSSFADASRME
ncbi:hypothetical protein Tco_0468641 [Tanacetum coccineum]